MQKRRFLVGASVVLATAPFALSAEAHLDRPRLSPTLYAKVASGVALVKTYDCSGRWTATGTGFLVGRQLLMTARHVVEPKPCRVRVFIGNNSYTASLIRFWRSTKTTFSQVDLATMRLDRPDRGYVFAFSAGDPPLGATLAMIGHPLGSPLTLAQGELVAKPTVAGVPQLLVSAITAGGASGSPILNRFGDVVGLLQKGFLKRDEGAFLGVDLARIWGRSASKDLCKQYPYAGVPGCRVAPPPPPLALPGHYCDTAVLGTSVCFDVTPDGRQLKNLSFVATVTCQDNSKETWKVIAPDPVAIGSNGSFSFNVSGSRDFPLLAALNPSLYANFAAAGSLSGTFNGPSNASGADGITQMSWDSNGAHYTCSGTYSPWSASRE